MTKLNYLSKTKVLGYSVASVSVNTIICLLGTFWLPFLIKKINRSTAIYILKFLTSSAISVLVSDALLHLIPEGFDLHSHSSSHENHIQNSHEHTFSIKQLIFRSSLVLLGAYAIFLIENCLSIFGLGHSHDSTSISETNSKQNNDIQFTNNINGCLKHENCCAESQLATHKGNKALPWFKRLTSMGWLILVAAGLHKFVDGVVIGASFNFSFSSGLSSSIAIMLHEVAHEIGDVAILIENGLNKWQALFANLISGLTAFLGVFVGWQSGEKSVPYILLFTAGTFLYIAFTEMLHQLNNFLPLNKSLSFFIINSGFFFGYALMVIIALYAENILPSQ